ncbi:MAG: transketolase [Myxococcota bacterium]
MPTGLDLALRERVENTIRFLAVDAVEKAGCGHPGAPMGLARVAFELWDGHLRFDPSDPEWIGRDRFVLSNGHASMLLYSLLHLYGFNLSLDDLRSFRTLGSKTPGHPEYGDTPGVELTTGPLGQGFAQGVGMALAGRMTRARYSVDGRGPGNHFVYGIVSDGDLMEGISSEAGSLAGHLRLGNLIYVYDDNEITIDGPTSVSFSEDVARRFEAQRWHVQIVDGNRDFAGLDRALVSAREEPDRPSIIIAKTTIGYGSPGRAGKSKAHGEKLGADEVKATKEAMGWPLDPTFLIPHDVRDYLKRRSDAKRAERVAFDRELEQWRAANPSVAQAWDGAREGRLPEDLAATLTEGLSDVSNPTRKHGAVVLTRLENAAPYFVGGSADLAGSAAPPILKERGTVGSTSEGRDPFAGTNIHFGVREHAMGAIANGIALDGTLRPYCGTFLIFSDYMRPAIRLSALMRIPTTFVFTHDSIFLGEDGPTHQPIEQLDSLRAIPGLTLFRPADGIETAMAWAWIAEHRDGPAMLALTRQTTPSLSRPASFTNEDVWRGGYALVDPGVDTRVVLAATGSEVGLACEAAEQLVAAGIPTKVVSVPSVELLLAQSDEYRADLFCGDTPVVAVEASSAESLRRLIGRNGLIYGIDRFGSSAPFSALAKEYGFTAEQLRDRVLEHLGEPGA